MKYVVCFHKHAQLVVDTVVGSQAKVENISHLDHFAGTVVIVLDSTRRMVGFGSPKALPLQRLSQAAS